MLDYGSGNLRSAERALRRVGADVEVTADRQAALECDGLVVPGVGAFAACMAGLREVRGEQIIDKRLAGGRPGARRVRRHADPVRPGHRARRARPRAAASGRARSSRLEADVVPHMGWNTVRAPAGSVLFDGLDADTRFYFVHSYAAREWSCCPSTRCRRRW